MTVSLGGTTSVDINNVVPGGPAKTGSLFVTTTTDNPSGYTTTINTDSNVDNCLKPTSATNCASTTNKIDPTTGTIATKSALNPNQWGASLATSFSSDPGQDSAWFAVPVNASSPVTISNSTSPNNPTGTSTQLTFGSKVDLSIPATTYQNTVVVTAVANAYVSAPTITSISPNTGPATGGTTITVNGANFNTAYQVFIDINSNGIEDSGEACLEADIISNTKITCQTPAAAADTYDVVVKTWGGATKTGSGTTSTANDNYTYQPPVTVTAIVPSIASTITPSGNGSGSNGPQFSIAGTNLGSTSNPPTVTIGGKACTEITVNDAGTALTCSGPTTGLVTGNQAVVVTNNGQNSNNDQVVAYNSISYPTLQSLTGATCSTTPTIYRDSRDSQLYYIAKLQDNKCWMLDNLKYKPNGDSSGTVTPGFSAAQVANTGLTNTLNVDGTPAPGTDYDNFNAAKYIDPIASKAGSNYCQTNTNKPTYNITKCGLLYNFYTATAGVNNTVTSGEVTSSICPTNWHLPTGRNTSGDFGVLDAAYPPGVGDYHSGNLAAQNLWLYSGVFAGVLSGSYSSNLVEQGISGHFWSSSVDSALRSHKLYFYSSLVEPNAHLGYRDEGDGVRCVIETPPASTPPAAYQTKTTNIVPNFASTATPSGDGNANGPDGTQFSIVGTNFDADSTVTIGNKACTNITVNSAGTAMTCTGPTSGMTDGEKRVTINGSDAGDDYTVFYSSYNFPILQSLTSATCNTTPTIYRDTRDSQLYYVNRLADNKCWMLDNLKYKPNGDSTGTVTPDFRATQVADIGTGNALTVDGIDTGGTNYVNYDAAKYIDPIASTLNANYCRTNTNKPINNITKCGLLYNFYTANAGTTPSTATSGNSTGSICPAHWRLSTGYNSDPTQNDFAALNGYMAGDSSPYQSATTDSKYYSGWQYSGAFAGVFSGGYASSFYDQGSYGYFWSSSVYYLAGVGYILQLDSSFVVPGTNPSNRNDGLGVRCVIGS
jgi:uncharacterized protein (TIGR02145 family)